MWHMDLTTRHLRTLASSDVLCEAANTTNTNATATNATNATNASVEPPEPAAKVTCLSTDWHRAVGFH